MEYDFEVIFKIAFVKLNLNLSNFELNLTLNFNEFNC